MTAPIALATLLAGAAAGAVVDIPAGIYSQDEFPVVVPAGVTLRGAGSARVAFESGGRVAVVLGGDGAVLEGVTIRSGAVGGTVPASVIGHGHDGLHVRECHVESIGITGGAGHVVTGNVVAGGCIRLIATTDSVVRANYQHGCIGGMGLEIVGGAGHLIAENELTDDLCAISCIETVGVRIERNRDECHATGIRLVRARDSSLYRNRSLRTPGAVEIDGGTGNRVEKQMVEHGDRGISVERGAAGTLIADSWLHDCRIGVVVTGASTVELRATAISEPRERAVLCDGGTVVSDNDLDAGLGGDTPVPPT